MSGSSVQETPAMFKQFCTFVSISERPPAKCGQDLVQRRSQDFFWGGPIFRDLRRPTFSGIAVSLADSVGGGSSRNFWASPITISQPHSVGGGSGRLFWFFGNRRSRSVKLPQFRDIFLDISGSPRDYPKWIAEKIHLPKVWGGPWPPWPPPWLRHWPGGNTFCILSMLKQTLALL